MRFVGYYTIRLNSTRVPHKSVRELGGERLLNHSLRTLNNVERIDSTILYSSHDLAPYISPDLGYMWVQRPDHLDGDLTTFNEILDSIIDSIDTDFIVFLTCTSPFITVDTINDMLDHIESDGHDSAFTAYKYQMFSWYADQPLNYDPSRVPRTQDVTPVYIETSGLYIFSKRLYTTHRRRIGFDPYIKEVDLFEGWDIDTPRDWEIAEWIQQVRDKKGLI